MPDSPRLKIFISSPGDVRPERLIAQRVILRLAREFAHYFAIEPVLWEREPLVATAHFQTMITPPAQTDIAVVILWSSMGTHLPSETFKGPLSGGVVTGTEYEFEDAMAANQTHGRPDLLLYRKQATVYASLDDDAALERQRDQKRRVEKFMHRWFVEEETGTFKAASHQFGSASEFEEMLETHLRALLHQRVDEERVESTPVRWVQGSPYRGLESFGIEHAPVFFGRTRARNELRTCLTDQTARGTAFVLVLGASGSGKSSLVKAGLLPDITLPGMIANVGLCRYAIFRPGDGKQGSVEALAAALFQTSALPELKQLQYDEQAIASLLAEAPEQVIPSIRQGLARAGESASLTERAEARLCLVVDQLEELFTSENMTDTEGGKFISSLMVLARSGLVWVVATMRSDFFDRLEKLPELAALTMGSGRYLLTPPNIAEIGEIISQPAREAGLKFETDATRGTDLAEILREAASHNPSVLPLLEFTLDQLWNLRSETGELTFAAYSGLGGLEGALARRAEEVFTALPNDVQSAFPSVLRNLLTVRHDPHFRVTARAAALDAFGENGRRRALVDAFLAPKARLFTSESDGTVITIRIAHEALLSHWPRARDEIESNRSLLAARHRVETMGRAWVEDGRDPSRLLTRGNALDEGEMLLNYREEFPTELVEFIEASLAEADARAQRDLRQEGVLERLPVFEFLVTGILFLGFFTATILLFNAWGGFAVLGSLVQILAAYVFLVFCLASANNRRRRETKPAAGVFNNPIVQYAGILVFAVGHIISGTGLASFFIAAVTALAPGLSVIDPVIGAVVSIFVSGGIGIGFFAKASMIILGVAALASLVAATIANGPRLGMLAIRQRILTASAGHIVCALPTGLAVVSLLAIGLFLDQFKIILHQTNMIEEGSLFDIVVLAPWLLVLPVGAIVILIGQRRALVAYFSDMQRPPALDVSRHKVPYSLPGWGRTFLVAVSVAVLIYFNSAVIVDGMRGAMLVSSIAPAIKSHDLVVAWIEGRISSDADPDSIVAEIGDGNWHSEFPRQGLARIIPGFRESTSSYEDTNCGIRLSAAPMTSQSAPPATVKSEQEALRFCLRVTCSTQVFEGLGTKTWLFSSHESKNVNWSGVLAANVLTHKITSAGGYCTIDGLLAEEYQG